MTEFRGVESQILLGRFYLREKNRSAGKRGVR